MDRVAIPGLCMFCVWGWVCRKFGLFLVCQRVLGLNFETTSSCSEFGFSGFPGCSGSGC
jgi:hypothetical protein